MFLMKEVAGIVNIKIACVDVRDCALAHFNAIKVPQAANRRFMLVGKCIWLPELCRWLEERYGDYYDIPHLIMPRWLVTLGSFFREDLKYVIHMLDVDCQYDTNETNKILGIKFRDMKTSVFDMIETLITTKHIPDYRG